MAYEIKCEKCGLVLNRENSPFGWGRCTEHWKCDDCGTKEKLCGYTYALLCDACHTKRVNKKIAKFTDDTCFEDDIICPYCGYKFQDSWEFGDNEEADCPECENSFDVEVIREIKYTTTKKKK